MRLGMVVEGHGETIALPSLVTRIAALRYNRYDIILPKPPVRVRRGRFAPAFLDYERALQLLAPQVDSILVVLDSDDDEPAALIADLESRARTVVGHRAVGVAPAVREYEAWFLASLPEMAGSLDLPTSARYELDPESSRGAKGVFASLLSTGTYSETIDQKKYSNLIDIAAACERSASFSRLVNVIGGLIA